MWRPGHRNTASAFRPMPRRCWTSTPSAARSFSPPCSMAAPPKSAVRRRAMAPRCTSPSPRTTPGCRCASSASVSKRATKSRPMSSCSPTSCRGCCPARARGSPVRTAPMPAAAFSPTFVPTKGWAGSHNRPGSPSSASTPGSRRLAMTWRWMPMATRRPPP